MIRITEDGAFWHQGKWLTAPEDKNSPGSMEKITQGRRGSMAFDILMAHNKSSNEDNLALRFDALASHDITYVGIIQTARASGLKAFPMPYVLTNCHNSLCAVGGTINEDDHVFGLSAARKYGGDFVPPNQAVIHQYMREMWAGGGKMILGSDSHTRYGALGTLAIGEGGPELVKQLLNNTYDIKRPEVVAIWMTGKPRPGVGPQDISLALIAAVFKKGLVKNRIMEFFGPGLEWLSVEYRMGIDVMTTETTCLSSIWQTDNAVRDYLKIHGRENDFKTLAPKDGSWYDLLIEIELDKIEPMIALPFHPSNAYPIKTFLENAPDLLAEVEKEARSIAGPGSTGLDLSTKLVKRTDQGGKIGFLADQAIVAGCAGGSFENLHLMAKWLRGKSTGNGAFGLSLYPASQPQYLELLRNGDIANLVACGATIHPAFCGPCFGAGDVPKHNGFSLRHTTRNFPNREGSRPDSGQISYVALMDARSIAATVANGGFLTSATEIEDFPAEEANYNYKFDPIIYAQRIYRGWGHPHPEEELIFGPNITDWPAIPALPESLLLTVTSAIYDPVTTTDELIPSGETSSYRSNPLRLAEFTLSRKDPEYVGRAKEIVTLEEERKNSANQEPLKNEKISKILATVSEATGTEVKAGQIGFGSVIFAIKPGDGSAREQAASCQRVLGGVANVAEEYATKRYRSNLVNWGMLPFILKDWSSMEVQPGDRIYIPHLRQALVHGLEKIPATIIFGWSRTGEKGAVNSGKVKSITLELPQLTAEEKEIILDGCLMNNYARKNSEK